jgi:C4-dicarboxylate transporter DctQ subunit
MLIFTLLGAAWVLRREEHIIIDLLLNRLRPRRRAMAAAINHVICAVVCLMVAWYGALVCLNDLQIGAVFYKAIILPKTPIMSSIPIGFFLLSMQSMRAAYQNLRRWKTFSRESIKSE